MKGSGPRAQAPGFQVVFLFDDQCLLSDVMMIEDTLERLNCCGHLREESVSEMT